MQKKTITRRIRYRFNKLKDLDKNVVAVFDVVLFVSKLGSVCVLKSNETKLVFSPRATFFHAAVLLLTLLHFIMTPHGIIYIENVSSFPKMRLTYETFRLSFLIQFTVSARERFQFGRYNNKNAEPAARRFRSDSVSNREFL